MDPEGAGSGAIGTYCRGGTNAGFQEKVYANGGGR